MDLVDYILEIILGYVELIIQNPFHCNHVSPEHAT